MGMFNSDYDLFDWRSGRRHINHFNNDFNYFFSEFRDLHEKNMKTSFIKAEEAQEIYYEVPGFSREDLTVSINHEKSQIVVTGKKQVGHNQRVVNFFSYVHRLKERADGITAKCENGLLKVNVPALAATETKVTVQID